MTYYSIYHWLSALLRVSRSSAAATEVSIYNIVTCTKVHYRAIIGADADMPATISTIIAQITLGLLFT